MCSTDLEPLRTEALKAETDLRKTQASSAREDERLRSIAIASQESLALADDPKAMLNYWKARKTTLGAHGYPTEDTDEMIAALEAGEHQKAVQWSQKGVDMGYERGYFKAPPKPAGYTNIKQGADGRTYGLNPETRQFEAIETPGGVELTSQNPVMEQLAMMQAQLALDGKKQSIAAAESAEARAAEKAEREAALAQTEQQSAEQTQRKSRMAAEGLVGLTRELLDDKDGLDRKSVV